MVPVGPHLPELRRLGPLPGEADASAPRAGGAETPTPNRSIDTEILRKVRVLLAKAESSAFEAEAEAFTAKAQTLIVFALVTLFLGFAGMTVGLLG